MVTIRVAIAMGLPNVHNNTHVSRHSNLDSSDAEESETEYSDEEREYVYYVNRPSNQTASHV